MFFDKILLKIIIFVNNLLKIGRFLTLQDFKIASNLIAFFKIMDKKIK